MRAVIFANGELTQPVAISSEDLVIAADGGAHYCLNLQIDPRYVIGDLDSLSADELSLLRSRGAQIIQFPPRKDFTDLELALQHALKLDMDEILIYGALGKRWDQTVANLLLAGAYPQSHIRLVDGSQEFFYIRSGERHEIPGQPGDTVSLISLTPTCEGITTRNMEYPLDGETLYFGSTRGVSNLLLREPASVQLGEGLLLCVVIHQQ